MVLQWEAIKDPDEVKDYSIDWSARLAGDTINSVTWTVPTGLTKDSQSLSGAIATAWFSGGTAGTTYQIGCRVVTAGGRTYDVTVRLRVRSR